MPISTGLASALSMLSGLGGIMLGGTTSARAADKQYKQAKDLLFWQYKYNLDLASHAHEREVADLKAAGLNPILSANNGQSASVGLPSANAVDNSAQMSNTFADAMNTAIQNSTSAKAVDSQTQLNREQENFLQEQAKTEQNKRENLDSSTKMNNLSAIGKEIENSFLPDKLKSEIQYNINSAKAVVAQAGAAQTLASSGKALNDSNIELNEKKGQLYDLDKWAKAYGVLAGSVISAIGLGKLGKLKYLKNIKGVSNYIKPATNYIKF